MSKNLFFRFLLPISIGVGLLIFPSIMEVSPQPLSVEVARYIRTFGIICFLISITLYALWHSQNTPE